MLTDGARGQEELGCDVAVGQSGGCQARDLELLGGELAQLDGGSPAMLGRVRAGGTQFSARPVYPWHRAETVEDVSGRLQDRAGVYTAAGPS